MCQIIVYLSHQVFCRRIRCSAGRARVAGWTCPRVTSYPRRTWRQCGSARCSVSSLRTLRRGACSPAASEASAPSWTSAVRRRAIWRRWASTADVGPPRSRLHASGDLDAAWYLWRHQIVARRWGCWEEPDVADLRNARGWKQWMEIWKSLCLCLQKAWCVEESYRSSAKIWKIPSFGYSNVDKTWTLMIGLSFWDVKSLVKATSHVFKKWTTELNEVLSMENNWLPSIVWLQLSKALSRKYSYEVTTYLLNVVEFPIYNCARCQWM